MRCVDAARLRPSRAAVGRASSSSSDSDRRSTVSGGRPPALSPSDVSLSSGSDTSLSALHSDETACCTPKACWDDGLPFLPRWQPCAALLHECFASWLNKVFETGFR